MTEARNIEVKWPKNVNEVPKEVFVREDLFEIEQEKIFRGPEWHPVAHTGELPNKGDFKTFDLGKVPLLITHGQDGEYRVFYNACSHRSNQLETASSGNKTEFECPYHRWLFNPEGELIGCPNSKEFSPGFKRENYPLGKPRTELSYGLIFVTMSEATPSLEEWIGDVMPTFKQAMGEDGDLRLLGYQKVSYKSNWKGYNDNDGYHAPLLHTAFTLLNWQGGQGHQYMDKTRGHLGFEADLKPVPKSEKIKDHSLVEYIGDEANMGSRLIQFFPTMVITRHLNVYNIRFAIARGPEDTEVHYAYFCHNSDDEEMVKHRTRQASNLLGPCGMVSMEDAAVFHRIHIGSNTPGNAIFQKGVKSFDELPTDVKQNDESGNLPRWEYYRQVMGFERAEV